MEIHIRNLPIEKRKKLRETTARIIGNMKEQNKLLHELYLLPNELAIKKAELMLKGRVSVGEYREFLTQTRNRYNEILKLNLELKK